MLGYYYIQTYTTQKLVQLCTQIVQLKNWYVYELLRLIFLSRFKHDSKNVELV